VFENEQSVLLQDNDHHNELLKYKFDLHKASTSNNFVLICHSKSTEHTRDGPIIIQTHRDKDMSSLASKPHDTDL